MLNFYQLALVPQKYLLNAVVVPSSARRSMSFVFRYSQSLRQSLISYIEEKYSFIITDEQADEYLDSLADLYEWLERNHKTP